MKRYPKFPPPHLSVAEPGMAKPFNPVYAFTWWDTGSMGGGDLGAVPC